LKKTGHHTRILIADDHEIVRLGIKFMLSDNDIFEILEEAINGFEVYELAKHYKPDLILMDYLMPEYNGIEAASKIKKLFPYIKIILFTAYEEKLNFYDILGSGIDAFLSKDISQDYFLYTIEQVMQNKFVFTKNTIMTLLNISYCNCILNEKPVVLNDELSEALRLFYRKEELLLLNEEKEKFADKLKLYFNYILAENNYDIKKQFA